MADRATTTLTAYPDLAADEVRAVAALGNLQQRVGDLARSIYDDQRVGDDLLLPSDQPTGDETFAVTVVSAEWGQMVWDEELSPVCALLADERIPYAIFDEGGHEWGPTWTEHAADGTTLRSGSGHPHQPTAEVHDTVRTLVEQLDDPWPAVRVLVERLPRMSGRPVTVAADADIPDDLSGLLRNALPEPCDGDDR